MEKKDKLYISLYNDYYGALLTPHQRDVVADYYDRDMSLAEIAAERGISPQGVRDTLQRAEKQLQDLERKLGIVAKSRAITDTLTQAADMAGDGAVKDKILDALRMI